MRANGDIQFAPVPIPQPETAPSGDAGLFDRIAEWLGNLIEPLARALGASSGAIFWVLVAVGAALVLYMVYRIVDPQRFARIRREDEEEGFAPERGAALALLEEADRLASEGLFDEATHLLLRRSVGQIAELRPDLIEPASTAREIAALPALPAPARSAFATIAERVERSIFALGRLDEADWQAARGAYAQFALGYRAVGTVPAQGNPA